MKLEEEYVWYVIKWRLGSIWSVKLIAGGMQSDSQIINNPHME